MKKNFNQLKKSNRQAFVITGFFLVLLFSCANKQSEYSRLDFALGSICQIRILSTLPKRKVNKVLDEIFLELKRLDLIFNANTNYYKEEKSKNNNKKKTTINEDLIPKNSELELINNNAGIQEIIVSEDLFKLLETSIFIAKKSNGAFNPAIGPLVKLWDIGFSGDKVPDVNEICYALSLTDYKNIVLKKKKKTDNTNYYSVFLLKHGMRLDFGGIAKGYATDKVVSILRKAGIKNALIDIAGNIFALGKNKKQKRWTIGLKNPNIGEAGIAASAKIMEQSIVTSGNYERYLKANGKIYHHILDSKTGYPIENKLNAVSIISKKSVYADALSTSCFALGEKKSKMLIDELNNSYHTDITAVFFYNDNSVRVVGNTIKYFSVCKPFVLRS